MKTNIKCGLTLVVGIAIGSFLRVPSEQSAHAAEPAAAEQYKLIVFQDLAGEPGEREAVLNKWAAAGWKVRTGVGPAIILAK